MAAASLVLSSCGSADVGTTAITVSIPTSAVTSQPTSTTTTASTTTTPPSEPNAFFERVTLDAICSAGLGEPANYQLTASAFGTYPSVGTGHVEWNGVEVATFDIELGKNDQSVDSFSVGESGTGLFFVEDNEGGIIYSASVSVAACESAPDDPEYTLTLSASPYCLEFYPYVAVVLDTEPFYEEDEPIVILVLNSDSGVVALEENYYFPGEAESLDLGGVSGAVYLFGVDAYGTSSNEVSIEIPDCFIADVSVIQAVATCGPDEEWTLAVELSGRPGAIGTMFYTWEGALDGEIWDFELEEDGTWSFTGFWGPGFADGTVSLDTQGVASGNVPVSLIECGE